MDFCEEVQEASIENRLNRSQTRALEKLKSASKQEFQRVTAYGQRSPNSVTELDSRDSGRMYLRDLSGREIEDIAEKAVKKNLTEFNWARVSLSLSLEAKILVMSRLGIPVLTFPSEKNSSLSLYSQWQLLFTTLENLRIHNIISALRTILKCLNKSMMNVFPRNMASLVLM